MQKTNIYFMEIDFVKTFAIFSVILLHILTIGKSSATLYMIYASFHIWQAVPLFMLLFGFTFRISIEKGHKLSQIFWSRFFRLLIPLFVAYILSFVIIIFFNIERSMDWHILIGQLPTGGMGNYFITLYFEAILFFLLLHFLVKQYNKIFTILFVVIFAFLGELISFFIEINDHYMYKSSIHQYALLIVLGYYFYDQINNNKRSMIIMGSLSLIFIFLNEYIYVDDKIAKTLNFSYIFYSFYTLMFAQILVYIYHNIVSSLLNKVVKTIGQSTLHIFITQIFIFNIIGFRDIEMNIFYAIGTLVITFSIGILWYKIETYILKASLND